jgi:SEC-C motif
MKIGRNQPCPCGISKKYKRCCGDPLKAEVPSPPRFVLEEMKRIEARERIRKEQQGLGKPIISLEHNGHRLVAVGNKVHFSTRWKVFTDFLRDYIQNVMGREWGAAEMAKPFEQRHPLLQWFEHCAAFFSNRTEKVGELYTAQTTGAICCYVGLAYNLYLISHNVELQERMVRRLRDPRNFQGAYCELIVANCLIRAGFRLELEDEADLASFQRSQFIPVRNIGSRRR